MWSARTVRLGVASRADKETGTGRDQDGGGMCMMSTCRENEHVHSSLNVFFFLGSAVWSPSLWSHVCRTMSREGGVHGVHKWGGRFGGVGGSDMGDGRGLCVCVRLCWCG